MRVVRLFGLRNKNQGSKQGDGESRTELGKGVSLYAVAVEEPSILRSFPQQKTIRKDNRVCRSIRNFLTDIGLSG